MSRRRRYADKELDELQKVRQENQKLKRQISSLRKQLQRVDLDRYQNLKDLVKKQAHEELVEKLEKEKKRVEKEWECRECRSGIMKWWPLSRLDGMFYYRMCSNKDCSNRTKPKPMNGPVEGVKGTNNE